MNIYADKGNTSDVVETKTNVSGQTTPIVRVTPERGTWLRLLNRVPTGDARGLPVYMKLRDSNGDPLPTNTAVQFRLLIAGQSESVKVSQEVDTITEWETLSFSKQKNSEHIDAVKMLLTEPEIQGGEPVENVDFRDIDELQFAITSAAQWDPSKSRFYIDDKAIKGPFQTE
jgi:hypothetical protein